MPPATGAAPAVVGSLPACSPSPAHWPAALTRSAAVTGRSVNSFLLPENVAQSGLRSKVSGLGTSVRLLRLRLDEHAARAEQNTATAIMRNPIWFGLCIATAPAPVTGLDRRAQRKRFCVSTIGLINGCFRFRTREVGAKSCPPYRAKARRAATPRNIYCGRTRDCVMRTAITQETQRNRKYIARNAGRLAVGTVRSITSPTK